MTGPSPASDGWTVAARERVGGEPTARAVTAVLLVGVTAVSVGWLALGAVVAATRYVPAVAGAVAASAAAGSVWAQAVLAAAPATEPPVQALADFAFSALNLALAVVLLVSGRRWAGARTWAVRLLAVALVGSAGAFNLQAHAAARAFEVATGLTLGLVHQVVLHGVACAAYILALLVFPTPSWDGLPGSRPVRGGLLAAGVVTFVLVGLGTALLPHTVSCVLFFGFLVPAVGVAVLPRRVRRGPGPEARAQARLLFSTLVGGFVVAAVLGAVTVLLWALDADPGMSVIDPTAHHGAAGGEPIGLLFWFSRLASAAVAVVVLVATRHDRLWTAERWFSRGLAVLLVTAAGGGAFVVLRAASVGVLGASGATVVTTAVVALVLGPAYVRAERVVDRLLYGTRPAPYRVLADIAALSQSTLAHPPGAASAGAPDLARVAEAVALGLGATVCRLTVRRPGLRDRTYEWTDRDAGPVGPQAGDGLLEVPIRHGAEVVGVLAVDRQAVSGLNAQRDHLLADIADGLGVVLEASRSGIELERQLRAALAHAEEIAVSRRRTVAEMDGERRRIERDLHDGAQHHLVSLRLTLGLVEHQVTTGALDGAREWLARLGEQLDGAEAVLAATADGVSSLVLAEKGLVAALRAELGAMHPPVALADGGIGEGRRFPDEVEAAVWFCCAEAVGNARKHAGGAPVTVALAEEAGALVFSVRDEGPGFAVPADGAAPGRGLRNMTARTAAAGGTVTVESAPGAGTTVRGAVPLPVPAEPVGTAPVVPPEPAPVGPVASTPPAAGPATPAPVAEPEAPAVGPADVAEPGASAPVEPERPAVVVEPDEPAPVGPEASAPVAATTPGPGAGVAPEVPVPPVAGPEVPVPATPVAEPEEPATAVVPVSAPSAEPDARRTVAGPDVPASATVAGEPEAAATAAEPEASAAAGEAERPERLAGQVRELVRAARAAYRGTPGEDRVAALAHRLEEPVRIGVLATVDEGRRMLVEALIGTGAAVGPAEPPDDGARPVRYVFGAPGTHAAADGTVVSVPAPALRAMTLVDLPGPGGAAPRRLGPVEKDRMRALLATPGAAPVADGFVLLMHYGRPADLTLLDLLDAAGYRGAIGVLARSDDAVAEDGVAGGGVADDRGSFADRAVREYGEDDAVRRVCHAVVPVAPATAAAAARLGDDEYRWLRAWVSATGADPVRETGALLDRDGRGGGDGHGDRRGDGHGDRRGDGHGDGRTPGGGARPQVAAALLDRLGPLGARRALRLVRSGEGGTRAALAGALVRHSGLADLQEVIAVRFLRHAEALRARSVLAGLDALLRTVPPPRDEGHRLRYRLELVRTGAHELREIELLDVLRSGELPLPDEPRKAAERLLGADGADVRSRLGLAADAPVEQVRAAVSDQPDRWRTLAAHPVVSTRVREFAQAMVRACERLAGDAAVEHEAGPGATKRTTAQDAVGDTGTDDDRAALHR